MFFFRKIIKLGYDFTRNFYLNTEANIEERTNKLELNKLRAENFSEFYHKLVRVL